MIDAAANSISRNSRRYAMAILTIVYMFNFIDRQILAILLPQIKAEFDVSDTYLGFLSGTAFAMFYITLGVPIARFADRCNRRNLIAFSVALWSAMTALSGFAQNIWHLTAARIGVGIGEAGCSPPAHSMIADYYPPEKRSAAMGVYTLGIAIGIMLAYVAGGWVAQNIGWREAFLLVGIPGILLAVIVRYTIAEPTRGSSEGRSANVTRPTYTEVVVYLTRRRSFIHMALAAGLSSFAGYAVISFLPSFMVRSFDLTIANLGLWLGLILGVSGGAGFYLGGYIADRLGKTAHQRALNFISLMVLFSGGLLTLMLLSKSWLAALLLFIIPAGTANVYLAPVLGQTQSLVGLRMRAVASALILLIINVIGLAFGSWMTGALSDFLQPSVGVESMRYSLLAVVVITMPWAAFHYFRAGTYIDRDLANVSDGA